MEYKWNDGLLCGSRQPMLVLVSKGQLYSFSGEHIPGVLAVLGESFVKNGKWSNSDWTMVLAEGVKAFEIVKQLHGCPWLAEHQSWDEVADYFEVERDEVERFFHGLSAYRRGCEILDEREAALISLKTGEGHVSKS